MDGVLVDSRSVVERTWRRWAGRHGLDAEGLIRAAHGRRTMETLREMAPALAFADEVAWLDAAELEDFAGIVAVPGAVDVTGTLPEDRWAVVTSAGRELAERRLATAGVRVPPVLVSSEDVSRGKPEPDGYLLAARRLGQQAGRCLVVEDAPPGIAAAGAAGMRVLALSTTHPAEGLAADRVIPDLTRLRVTAAGADLLLHFD